MLDSVEAKYQFIRWRIVWEPCFGQSVTRLFAHAIYRQDVDMLDTICLLDKLPIDNQMFADGVSYWEAFGDDKRVAIAPYVMGNPYFANLETHFLNHLT